MADLIADRLEIAKYLPTKITTKLTKAKKVRGSDQIAQPSKALKTVTIKPTRLANPEDIFLRQ